MSPQLKPVTLVDHINLLDKDGYTQKITKCCNKIHLLSSMYFLLIKFSSFIFFFSFVPDQSKDSEKHLKNKKKTTAKA
jgi:hypothetical protein